MRRYIFLLFMAINLLGRAQGVEQLIEIPAGDWKLSLMVGADHRLYQLGSGKVSSVVTLPSKLPAREREFLPAYGNGYIADPAVQVTHADGNTSLDLHYVKHNVEQLEEGVTQTKIEMKDAHYPFFANVFVKSYSRYGIMEIWTEYCHTEHEGSVMLYRYASAAPLVQAHNYWLTQFNGRYKREATIEEERLARGIKTINTNLGVRSNYYVIPSIILSCNQPAAEDSGEVYGYSLKWAGNFQFSFDYNWSGALRIISGINPLGAQYCLAKDSNFVTPAVVCCYSSEGKGLLSRRFHRWADQYVVRDPAKNRPVILNNWEATHCNFDESRLIKLFEGASNVGAELFLLDDGWFGNDSCARDDDRHGLGDWQVDRKKLPRGLSYLTREAQKRNLGFGIWLEPEMVNPRSLLYQSHPDWIIGQPYREPILGRHQHILDLTRPEVYAFEQGIFQDVLGRHPDIAYVKWDCNRFVTQPGSGFLPVDRQSHLLVDYTFSLYRLMDHFARTYPDVMAMICAGGSGRVDFGSLYYFHSFWPSDNTDPIDRIRIQWGFSHFFPAKTLLAHVTRMGRRHLKLAIDVALSGAFGIDLAIDQATQEERRQLAHAVALYKSTLRPMVMHGDLYRLLSPYESPVASLSYVSPDKHRAVAYLYQVDDSTVSCVRLKGLDPGAQYAVRELDTSLVGTPHVTPLVRSGQSLMTDGLDFRLFGKYDSAIIEIVKQ